MKRNGKLLALVMAVAMVMTMVVIPVSAATPDSAEYVAPTGVNLFAEWGYSWDNDTSYSKKYTTLYGNASQITFAGSSTASSYDNGETGKGWLTANDTFKINNVPIEKNAYYKLTADVKLSTASTATMSFSGQTNSSITKVAAISTSNANVTNSDWTTVEFAFKGQVLSNANTKLTNHISLKSSDSAQFIVDNWTLTKMEAASTTGFAINENNDSVTFTFSRDVTALTESNFTVSPTVDFNVAGNTVTLTGYTAGTEYTITGKNIKDIYGQTLAKQPVVVVKAGAPSIDGYDFEDEVVLADGEITTADGTVYEGSKGLSITAEGGAVYDVRATGTFKGVQAGKTYVVSFYAKAAAGSSNSVKAYLSNSSISANNANYVKLGTTDVDYIDINDTEWTKVTCCLNIVGNYYDSANKHSNLGIHAGVAAKDAGTYYIDNFQISEANALDIANDMIVLKDTNKDGDVELTLSYKDNTKTVYFAAAKYEAGKLADVKFDSITLDGTGTQTAVLKGVTNDYKIFVWDNGLKPLNNVLSISDF